MEVYVVCEVVDEEYGGFEIIFITANEERAKEYCEKNNSKWEHWSGTEYDSVYYLTETVEDCN